MNATIKKAADYPVKEIEETVAVLIYESFQTKFTVCLFSSKEAHKIALTLSYFLCTIKAEQLFLAETPHGIGGCVYLATKNDTYYYLKHLLKREYSIITRIKVTFLLSLLSHPVKATELYIDFMSVLPNFRSHGVGQQLMAHCKSLACKQHLPLTLYVAHNNQRALAFYQKEKFIKKKQRISLLTQQIVKNKRWYYMEWSELDENRHD
ncbi:GNAT family N-acetyltransferase [Erwinia sp. CPCC 100877]|nr:GNAT family N-acetyltransferase [Erwinia sp. CPCC 100877]